MEASPEFIPVVNYPGGNGKRMTLQVQSSWRSYIGYTYSVVKHPMATTWDTTAFAASNCPLLGSTAVRRSTVELLFLFSPKYYNFDLPQFAQ
jgi:hypothetical protein